MGKEGRKNLQTLKLCMCMDFRRLLMHIQLEAQHDVDEANKAQDTLASKLKELEKKIRTYETELNHTQEVHTSIKAHSKAFLPSNF